MPRGDQRHSVWSVVGAVVGALVLVGLAILNALGEDAQTTAEGLGIALAGEEQRERQERAEDVAAAQVECDASEAEPFPALSRYEYGELTEQELAEMMAIVPEEMRPAFSFRTIEWRNRPFTLVGAFTVGDDAEDFEEFERGVARGADMLGSRLRTEVINGVEVIAAGVPTGYMIVESGDCYARVFQAFEPRSAREAAAEVVGG